jgi:hypothetical protein
VTLGSEPRLVALHERLVAERADSEPFGMAWERACGEALVGLSAFDREHWLRVLRSTRWAWRSAYYRSSSRVDWVAELEAFVADGELESLAYELLAVPSGI